MLIALLAGIGTARGAPAPELEVDGDPHAGHLTLTWSSAQPKKAYQLEEAPRDDFKDAVVRYEGPHTSSVRSGLRNGVRFYRVRCRVGDDGDSASWSPWSAPVRFEVTHYSRTFALSLCALGAVVFGCTLAFLLGAARRERD